MKLTGLYSSSPLLFSNTRQSTRLDCSTLTNVFRKCNWNGSEPLESCESDSGTGQYRNSSTDVNVVLAENLQDISSSVSCR